MKVTIVPTSVQGRLQSNSSKSHAQRAIALAALAPGTSILEGIGGSADVQQALGVARAMGADIRLSDQQVAITGGRSLAQPVWHCGESGFSFRMFAAIAGLYHREITVTASGSLLSRPNAFVVETLKSMGVATGPATGIPPITIHGPYQHTVVDLDGSLSSQFLSGLLIALPHQSQDAVLTVHNLVSTPYIAMTLETLSAFGLSVTHSEYQSFRVRGNQVAVPTRLRIEGDWSGMAFILVAGIIAGDLVVDGLTYPSAQADAAIVDVLAMSQSQYKQNAGTIHVSQSDPVGFDYDATHCPDLIPALVPLALSANGISRVKGVHRLRAKESDRASALISEFAKLGADISIEQDALVIPGTQLHGGTADAHGDHRIAMALATAGLRATTPVVITGAEHVAKSYPAFFHDLQTLGVEMSIEE